MSIRTFLAATLVSIAFVAPGPAFADDSQRAEAPCIILDHHVLSAKPYHVNEQLGKASFRRLRGAELYIEAEEGLTAEWLRLKLGRHLAKMKNSNTMDDCTLDVDDVRVEVESAGAGFKVRLIAKDTSKAKEVLRRARLLVR